MKGKEQPGFLWGSMRCSFASKWEHSSLSNMYSVTWENTQKNCIIPEKAMLTLYLCEIIHESAKLLVVHYRPSVEGKCVCGVCVCITTMLLEEMALRGAANTIFESYYFCCSNKHLCSFSEKKNHRVNSTTTTIYPYLHNSNPK